ncbi:MAG: hypothetical protein ACR2HM_05965 [Acidimicrobiales bacterium]
MLAQLWADWLRAPGSAPAIDTDRVAAAVETARPVLCSLMVAVMLVFHHAEGARFIYFQF